MGIYIVSENFENFVLGMGIYIVFYKGFYVFYVYLSILGGWAYILFLSHFNNFVKRTTIYIDIYDGPTLYAEFDRGQDYFTREKFLTFCAPGSSRSNHSVVVWSAQACPD